MAASSTSVLTDKAAQLNKSELARAASAETAASASPRKAAVSGVTKFADGTRVPVYRFYVPTKGVHFY
ncbi:MAG: hypothetical protein KC492_04880, partial [Myxococcales bacterium]|nr:hypothetical protein [Myxococcales bacterium]